VSQENVSAVCDLELGPGQDRYVAPAAKTVAEAAYSEHEGWLWAIYAEGEPVGAVWVVREDADFDGNWFLVRLMVAADWQRRGIGRRALQLIAGHVAAQQDGRELWTSCVPGPDGPTRFYLAAGFVDTGTVVHDEGVLRLPPPGIVPDGRSSS
jgi:diamine N-acetyltransferase